MSNLSDFIGGGAVVSYGTVLYFSTSDVWVVPDDVDLVEVVCVGGGGQGGTGGTGVGAAGAGGGAGEIKKQIVQVTPGESIALTVAPVKEYSSSSPYSQATSFGDYVEAAPGTSGFAGSKSGEKGYGSKVLDTPGSTDGDGDNEGKKGDGYGSGGGGGGATGATWNHGGNGAKGLIEIRY